MFPLTWSKVFGSFLSRFRANNNRKNWEVCLEFLHSNTAINRSQKPSVHGAVRHFSCLFCRRNRNQKKNKKNKYSSCILVCSESILICQGMSAMLDFLNKWDEFVTLSVATEKLQGYKTPTNLESKNEL